jgi:uncharacterized protein YcbK (DUF882 family)
MCKCNNCSNSNAFKISLGLVGGLELLRSLAKQRINILKGYLCSENEETMYTKKNYHLFGLAADITIDNTDLVKMFELAEMVSEFKGIGINFGEKYIHVDTRKDDKRVLWVIKFGKKIDLTEENRKEVLGE